METNIAENLRSVRMDIAESERKAGRPVGSVELLAVSKTHPPEAIQQAVEAGQLLFGESKAGEGALAFDRASSNQQNPSGLASF
jgi:uncharacterized pyridoxal phosphate-containing UPF0001 family protein